MRTKAAAAAARSSPAAFVAAGAVLLVCVLFAVTGPGPPDPTSADEVLGRIAVEHMRDGVGYYPAMEQALGAVNGPPKTGRDYRQPAVFVFWRALPTDDAVWVAFAVLAAVAGLSVAATSEVPLVAPLVTLYILVSAAVDQQYLPEVWAGPLVIAAISAWRKGWHRAAATIAAAAVLVRELAVVVLVGGLLSRRRDPKPWLVALAVSALGVALHFAVSASHTSPDGSEAALLGTGGFDRVLDMAGVGFNHRALAGAVLWPLAWLRVVGDRELLRFMAPLLAIPALGLLVGRDYWGYVVVPAILLFALESAWSAAVWARQRVIRTEGALVGNP